MTTRLPSRIIVVAALLTCVGAVSSAAGSAAKTPRVGGTVVVGLREDVHRCLNFFYAPCGYGTPDALWLTETLEGAFELRPNLTYRPNLVSRVTFTKTPPFRFTYHIRPEARWSDGTPVTASDFVFTFQAFLRYGDLLEDDQPYRKIRRVRALDPKTIRVVLRSRFAGWRSLFHVVLPQHALAGEDLQAIWRKAIDNPRTGRPIGSGPFLVQSLQALGRDLVLVRNPRYWGPHKAYLDRIVIRSYPDGDQADALRRGEVDLVALSGTQAADFRGLAGISVRSRAGTGWEHFAVRVGAGGHPALKSKLVRRALAYGIDRKAVLRRLYGRIAPDLQPLENAILLTNSTFYEPHWSVYRYRPAEARRLLEQAGCRKGADGIYACGGQRLSLRVFTTAGDPDRELVLRLVQRQLGEIGVNVVPMFAPGPVFFTQIVQAGEYDLALFRFIYSPDSSASLRIFRCGGSFNWTGYCNRQAERDLMTTELIHNEKQRARVLNRADAKLAKDVPVIPLFQVLESVAFKSALRGVIDMPPPEGFTWNSEDWRLAT